MSRRQVLGYGTYTVGRLGYAHDDPVSGECPACKWGKDHTEEQGRTMLQIRHGVVCIVKVCPRCGHPNTLLSANTVEQECPSSLSPAPTTGEGTATVAGF